MNKNWNIIGALFAFLAVVLGAFGAHGLESRVTPHLLEIFKTAAYYQMVHSIALLILGLRPQTPGRRVLTNLAGWLFVAGIVVFSGSLYTLVFTENLAWGRVTPLGGLCFMAGWLVLVGAEFKKP